MQLNIETLLTEISKLYRNKSNIVNKFEELNNICKHFNLTDISKINKTIMLHLFYLVQLEQ